MSSVKRALLFSFLGKYSAMLLQFVSIMVISRLLTPTEIGVYSLAAGAIVIGQMLRDFGLSLYLIQEKELTLEKIRSTFTISLIICWTIAFLYYLGSGVIAGYLNQPKVEVLIQILAINFLIIPFGTFTLSLLRREMRFDRVMFIDVTSTVFGTATSIVMAMQGYGVLALAFPAVISTIVTALMSFRYAKWEHYRLTFSNFFYIIKFSSLVSGSNILGQLRGVVPEFLIGKHLSAGDVAFFSKANAAINLFSQLIISFVTPVIQPYMSKLKNSETAMDKPVYAIMHNLLVFQWPFCAFVFMFSEELIYTLYGSQWGESIPLVKVFAFLLFVDGLAVMSEQMLNSVGEVKFVFRYSVVMTVVKIALVFMFLDQGLMVIALAFFPLSLLRAGILLPKFKSTFSLRWQPLMQVYGHNFLVFAAVLLACYGISLLPLEMLRVEFRFLIFGALVFFVWCGAIFATSHPISERMHDLFMSVQAKFTRALGRH